MALASKFQYLALALRAAVDNIFSINLKLVQDNILTLVISIIINYGSNSLYVININK